jgi:hypothetical protein
MRRIIEVKNAIFVLFLFPIFYLQIILITGLDYLLFTFPIIVYLILNNLYKIVHFYDDHLAIVTLFKRTRRIRYILIKKIIIEKKPAKGKDINNLTLYLKNDEYTLCYDLPEKRIQEVLDFFNAKNVKTYHNTY